MKKLSKIATARNVELLNRAYEAMANARHFIIYGEDAAELEGIKRAIKTEIEKTGGKFRSPKIYTETPHPNQFCWLMFAREHLQKVLRPNTEIHNYLEGYIVRKYGSDSLLNVGYKEKF